jgi:hypothetical protein
MMPLRSIIVIGILEWDELVSKYLSIRAQEREVQAGLQEESVIKGQLEDVKRKLEVFEKARPCGRP